MPRVFRYKYDTSLPEHGNVKVTYKPRLSTVGTATEAEWLPIERAQVPGKQPSPPPRPHLIPLARPGPSLLPPPPSLISTLPPPPLPLLPPPASPPSPLHPPSPLPPPLPHPLPPHSTPLALIL